MTTVIWTTRSLAKICFPAIIMCLLLSCIALLQLSLIFDTLRIQSGSCISLYKKSTQLAPVILHPWVPSTCHAQNKEQPAISTHISGDSACVTKSVLQTVELSFSINCSVLVCHTCTMPIHTLPSSCSVLTSRLAAVMTSLSAKFITSLVPTLVDVCLLCVHFFAELLACMFCTSWGHLIIMDIVPPLSVKFICSIVELILCRYMMCKHDFCAHFLRAWWFVPCMGSSVTLFMSVSSFLVSYSMSLHPPITLSHPVMASAPCFTSVDKVVGGCPPYLFPPELILPYVKFISSSCINVNLEDHDNFSLKYVAHVDGTCGLSYSDKNKLIYMNVSLKLLVPHIPLKAVCNIVKAHDIPLDQHTQDNRALLCELFEAHRCTKCLSFCMILLVQVIKKSNCMPVTVGEDLQ